MELLSGHDLAWHLRHRTRLPLDEVVTLVEQVARGLEAAHAAGIVHRDLKPPNLFLHEAPAPREGEWKILDFGVSKLRESSGTLTEGALVGTPGYMAPEQVRSENADGRADVFALGAVAYRALTGQPAFGVTDVQAVFDVVYRQPSAPSELLRGLSRDVDRVLAIALEKKVEGRFASAGELAAALRLASRGELAPELTARADAILRARPWGSVKVPG
jgi:serine/threonine protein kinase